MLSSYCTLTWHVPDDEGIERHRRIHQDHTAYMPVKQEIHLQIGWSRVTARFERQGDVLKTRGWADQEEYFAWRLLSFVFHDVEWNCPTYR